MSDAFNKFYDEFKAKTDYELESLIRSEAAQREKAEAIKLILDEREKKRQSELAQQTLDVTKSNADSTKKLVWATWGLVIVTAILALITFFGYFTPNQ